MSETSLPPCGPARDRLVAELLGWTAVGMERDHRHTECVDFGVAPGDSHRKPIPSYSTSDADALAALKAWKAKTQGSVNIILDSAPDAAFVALEDFEGDVLLYANRPTLADAATAALVRWRNERSAT